jgi:hypothetical protein
MLALAVAGCGSSGSGSGAAATTTVDPSVLAAFCAPLRHPTTSVTVPDSATMATATITWVDESLVAQARRAVVKLRQMLETAPAELVPTVREELGYLTRMAALDPDTPTGQGQIHRLVTAGDGGAALRIDDYLARKCHARWDG